MDTTVDTPHDHERGHERGHERDDAGQSWRGQRAHPRWWRRFQHGDGVAPPAALEPRMHATPPPHHFLLAVAVRNHHVRCGPGSGPLAEPPRGHTVCGETGSRMTAATTQGCFSLMVGAPHHRRVRLPSVPARARARACARRAVSDMSQDAGVSLEPPPRCPPDVGTAVGSTDPGAHTLDWAVPTMAPRFSATAIAVTGTHGQGWRAWHFGATAHLSGLLARRPATLAVAAAAGVGVGVGAVGSAWARRSWASWKGTRPSQTTA